MSDIIGNAQILLSANTARFEQGLARASDSAKDTFADMKEQAISAGKGIAVGLAVATVALGEMIKSQVEAAVEMEGFARTAGVSTQKMQEMAAAAKMLGIDTDDLNDVFEDLNDKIGEFTAENSGELKDLFEKLPANVNLTAESFRKLSGPDALQAYYNALEKANLTGTEMIHYMEEFASESSKLIPMLRNNGEGFKLVAEAAENAGAVMDKKTIRAAQEMKTASDLMELSLKGVKNQMTQGLIPVMSDMAGALVKDTKLKDTAKVAGDNLAGGFKFIMQTGRGVVGILEIIGKGLGAVAASFVAFLNSGQAIDTSNPLTILVSMGRNAVNAVESVKGVWSDFWQDMKTSAAATSASIQEMGTWGTGGTNATVSKLTDIKTEMAKSPTGKAKIKGDDDDDDDDEKGGKKSKDKLKDLQVSVFKAWTAAGLSAQQAKIMTAEVGREGDFLNKNLFGFHEDRNNHEINMGMLSWQKTRGTNLKKFLTDAGLFKDGHIVESQESLNAMAQFAVKEMLAGNYKKTKNQFLNNPNINEQQAFEIEGREFVGWDIDGKYGMSAKNVADAKTKRNRYYQTISAKVAAGIGGANGGSELKDYQQLQQSQEQIEKSFADQSAKRLLDYQEQVKKINASFTDPDDSRRQRYLDQAKAEYDRDIAEYKFAQDQKLAKYTDFKKSERDKILENTQFEIRATELDKNLSPDLKKQALEAIKQKGDYQLAVNQLVHDKEEYNNEKEHLTTLDRIHRESVLQQTEIALNNQLSVKAREERMAQVQENEETAKQNAQQSFQDELEQITGIGKSELQKTMDDFEKKRRILDKREDIDDSQKSTLRNALAGSEIRAKSDIRKTAETGYNSMIGDITGNTAALEINNKYKTQHETLLKWKQQELITTEKYNDAMQKSNFSYMIATNQLYVSTGGSIANSVSEIGKIMLGENQKSYKALFAMNQSFVMAQAGLNMYKAISDAWANGSTIYDKMAGAATAATELVKIITAAQQVKMQGFASGGYTGDIPENAVAGLVHGGEYVFDAEATKAIGKNKLEKIRRGDLDPSTSTTNNNAVSVNVVVNHDGSSSVESSHEIGKTMGDAIRATALQVIKSEIRQNGSIDRAIRRR